MLFAQCHQGSNNVFSHAVSIRAGSGGETDTLFGQIILIDMFGTNSRRSHKFDAAVSQQVGVDLGDAAYQQNVSIFD